MSRPPSTVLLDANSLIALFNTDHEHHVAVSSWLDNYRGNYATTPITEGALARFAYRNGGTPTDVTQLLRWVAADPKRVFWPDELSMTEIDLSSTVGHRQVTDTYLVSLAKSKGTKVVTFDFGLAILNKDAVIYLGDRNLP